MSLVLRKLRQEDYKSSKVSLGYIVRCVSINERGGDKVRRTEREKRKKRSRPTTVSGVDSLPTLHSWVPCGMGFIETWLFCSVGARAGDLGKRYFPANLDLK